MVWARWLAGVLSSLLAAITLAWPSAAQDKFALIVANKSYASAVGELSNPHKDADLIEAALTAAGFDVTVVKEASRIQLLAAVRAHGERVGRAGPGALALFYYTGHGAADAETGRNYLIPIDVQSTQDATLWDASVPISEVQRRLKNAAPVANHFVLFDACRNELELPFKDVTKGFEPEARTGGLFVGFATAPQKRASDGQPSDVAGPYALAFAEEIAKGGGRDASAFFEDVKFNVRDRASGQLPWSVNGLAERVYPFGVGGEPIVVDRRKEDAAKIAELEAALAAVAERPTGEAGGGSSSEVPPGWTQPAPASGRQAGDTFKECDVCPQMVVVPAGSFTMGSPASEEGREDDEGPQRTVNIGTFAVGKFGVTWAQWDACAAAGGCDGSGHEGRGGDEGWGKGSRPVINVDWNDARAYVRWLSSKTGETYRLLTEAEFEYVSRAGSTARYPNGSDSSRLCAIGNVADQTAQRTNSGWRRCQEKTA